MYKNRSSYAVKSCMVTVMLLLLLLLHILPIFPFHLAPACQLGPARLQLKSSYLCYIKASRFRFPRIYFLCYRFVNSRSIRSNYMDYGKGGVKNTVPESLRGALVPWIMKGFATTDRRNRRNLQIVIHSAGFLAINLSIKLRHCLLPSNKTSTWRSSRLVTLHSIGRWNRASAHDFATALGFL